MQQAKWCLKQRDPHLALMAYRSTPVEPTGLAPAQLLMGRSLQTRLPSPPGPVRDIWREANRRDIEAKRRMKMKFDKHHGARPLVELGRGDRVRVRTTNDSDWSVVGRVVDRRPGGRSYVIATDRGLYIRNRRHLAAAPAPLTHISHPLDQRSGGGPQAADLSGGRERQTGEGAAGSPPGESLQPCEPLSRQGPQRTGEGAAGLLQPASAQLPMSPKRTRSGRTY